jgi:hypothetical protein
MCVYMCVGWCVCICVRGIYRSTTTIENTFYRSTLCPPPLPFNTFGMARDAASIKVSISVKRDLPQCQKRPTTVSKETYYRASKCLSVSKETYHSVKRDLPVSKETYHSVKRDLLQSIKVSIFSLLCSIILFNIFFLCFPPFVLYFFNVFFHSG